VETLVSAGRNADLLIAECYTYDREVQYHLNYKTLLKKLPEIGAKRVLLTHMSPDMLDRIPSLRGVEIAHDGLEINLA
jgi:ribonuclease BN (tRNA processing enzyme)